MRWWAKSSDRPPLERQVLAWSPSRRDVDDVRATYISVAPRSGETLGHLSSRPEWGWGAEHGVNEAGVAVGNLSVFTRNDPRPFPPALTGMDLVRLALERGESAAAAAEVIGDAIDRYGQGGSGHQPGFHPYWSSFVLADATATWALDTSGPQWEAKEVGVAWAASNRPSLPGFDAEHRHPAQPVGRLVDPRLASSRALVDRTQVDRAALLGHLRGHSGVDGYSVCMHAGTEQQTTASMAVALSPSGPPRVWCAIGSPCASVYVPVAVGPSGTAPTTWPVPGPLEPVDRGPLDEAEAALGAEADADPSVVDDPEWADRAWEQALAAAAVVGRRR